MRSPRLLYHLPELQSSSGCLLVLEGEKCVKVLGGIGFIATTSSGGAKAAQRTDWYLLAARDVVIMPDNDTAGKSSSGDTSTVFWSWDERCQLGELVERALRAYSKALRRC